MKIQSIEFHNSKVSGAISGDTKMFQASVITKGTVQNDALKQLVAQDTDLTVEKVGYILDTADAVTLSLVRQGYQVQRGCTTYRPVLLGPFGSVDDVFTPGRNKLEVAATPRGDLRNCLSDVEAKNVESKPRPVIQSIIDPLVRKEKVLTIDDTIEIAGTHITIDVNQEGEGVWLEDIETGEKVADAVVGSECTDQLVDCTIEEWPDPGEYNLCLACRAGLGEDYSLVTVKKAVTVVPPENGGSEE